MESAPVQPFSADTQEILCNICNKSFKKAKYRNAHLKNIHKESAIQISKRSFINCPLCKDETGLKTHEGLRKHLEDCHQVIVNEETFMFASDMDYDAWKNQQEIETNYAMSRSSCRDPEFKTVYYDCNRSNYKGYKPNYQIRTEKAGGSIKIKGVCPSRLICKLHNDGQISVSFWKTHAGHEEELRSKHLSNSDEKTVVEKLQSGVPPSRILEDSRKLETAELGRLNLLTGQDIANLSRKYNVQKKRDQNNMVAAVMNVQEWNANGKNYAFLFKQEGETHEVLKKEDFALGFMNSVMEDKLRQFPNIICIDGTHGTNKRGMDLTILLIKDDRNAGFPVAFLLPNRLDQQVQEVFLAALKEKMQMEIECEYIMSDDDPKYYNAWLKIMGDGPKRLLCTWHVVKNWNIQGKKKIHDPTLKKQMKTEMKRIINETSEDRFMELCNNYLLMLQEANETDFVNYLTRYYFQDEGRIKMWAHCYRRKAGINTNMAIESLNNLLKTNQLKRNARVTIEKLLDTIDDLVDLKMWKRVVDIERPNANNYQDRVIIKAHKKAEAIKNSVKVTADPHIFGHYTVISSRNSEITYKINLKQLCEKDCRTLYCRVCRICIHRYECECPEYVVRNTLCKHVHLVRINEKRMATSSILDEISHNLGEHSNIRPQQKEEINEFIKEKIVDASEVHVQDQSSNSVEIKRLHLHNFIDNLDDDKFSKFSQEIQAIVRKYEDSANEPNRKRKMEKQEYFPKNKHQKKSE